MIITTSNILNGVSPTIVSGLSTSAADTLTDPDFSRFYVAASGATHLSADFGVTGAINYIAVAGQNVKGAGGTTNTIRVKDNGTTIATASITTDQVVVLAFASRSFTNLQIVAHTTTPTNPIQVTYMAAGNYITIPNSGEQSGYDRQHLKRNYKNKTTVNGLAEPISLLRKRIQSKGSLSIPNATKSFSENEWQTFLDFANDNLFFINEVPVDLSSSVSEGDVESCYLCYDPSSTTKAHGQTRNLHSISLKFRVLNGL